MVDVGERLPAMAAQFTQAMASLALSMVAVRVLDPTGFGQYSIIIATLLVMTGITTGLVGDSLTVLDRHRLRTRYALQVIAISSASACALVLAVLGIALSWFPPQDAPVIALAVFSFLLEDSLRRLLMANGRFAGVVAVDLSYALAAAIVLISVAQLGEIGLTAIFAAMATGQTFAIAVAVGLLPRVDRYLARRHPGGLREVLSFGGWRATLGVIGPSRQWAARMMVAATVGMAAVGTLEANRLLVAPVLLAVQGVGSAILVSYTRDFRASPSRMLRVADRDALLLGAGSLATVAAVVLAAPLLGRVLLGSSELVDPRIVVGWGLVGVGIAATLPFASLTSIAGAPRTVVGIRMIDLMLSLGGVWLLLSFTDASTTYVWAPAVLGAVVCFTAILQRRMSRALVRPLLESSASSALDDTAGPHDGAAMSPAGEAPSSPTTATERLQPVSSITDPRPSVGQPRWASADPPGARRWGDALIGICAIALMLASETKFVLKEGITAASSAVDFYIMLEVVVFALVALVLVTALPSFPRLAAWHPLEVGLLAYASVLSLSVLIAPSPAYAAIRAMEVAVTLLLVITARRVGDQWFLIFVRLFIVATLGLVLVGVLVEGQRGPLQVERFNWLATHPVVVGQFLALAFVSSLTLAASLAWRTANVRGTALLLVGSAVLAAALLANNTRGSGAAAAVGTAVGISLVLPRRLRASVFVVVAYAGIVAALTLGTTASEWITRGASAESLGSLNERLPLWRLAVSTTLQDSPILGLGVGASRRVFVDATGLGGGHNAVVNVLVDLGIIGLLLWGAVICYALLVVIRHVPQSDGQITERALWLATMTTLLVNGLTTEGIGGVANVGMVWMFLLVARATRMSSRDRISRQQTRSPLGLETRLPGGSNRDEAPAGERTRIRTTDG